jgi:hypothetical protein
MRKITNTSWAQLTGEGAAIVISILLAFAIDAWWEERAVRIEEQQVLQGLRSEFLATRDVLTGHLSEHLHYINVFEEFLSTAGDGDADSDGAIVDATLNVLLNPPTSDVGNGTLEALLSSGRIEILSSKVLRAKLAAWEGVMGEVLDDQVLNVKSVYEIHIPYLVTNNIPAGGTMHHWYSDWPLPRRQPSDDPDLVKRVLGDENLRVMVEINYGYKRHLTEEFEIAIAEVDAILGEIDSSIAHH